MHPYQAAKRVVLANHTVATDATNSVVLDRLGFDYAVFHFNMRPATATNSSAKWGALKLMEADTTAISDATNISGFIGTTNSTAVSSGTAVEFVIPAHNSTTVAGATAQNGGGQTIRLCVDGRGRKRYLFAITQGAASHQTAVISADLYRAKELPDSAADANVAALVVG